MYSTMLNLIYFVNCIGLVVRVGTIGNIMSVVIMSISGLLFIFAITRFYINPDPCGYFRYSFKLTTLALSHYLIIIIVLILAVVLLTIVSNLVWAPLIPSVLNCIFTMAYRPYKNLSDNIRSSFNMLVISSFLALRMYASNCTMYQLKS